MTKLWAFIRHNSGIIISSIVVFIVLAWCWGCQSEVTSIHNPPALVTRAELEVEVDHFLKQAEVRFAELDQKDEFKRSVYAMAMEFMSAGKVNPLAIAITLGNILGLGAVVDNVRKRTVINTLKGDYVNAGNKKDTQKKTESSKTETA